MSSTSMISVRNVWKVFGPNAEKLIGTPDADLTRTELRNKTGNTIAVRDVSFEVAKGEVFVVMGLSGSGKSTLMQLLWAQTIPSEGKISYEVNGQEITPEDAFAHLSIAAPYLDLIDTFTLKEQIDGMLVDRPDRKIDLDDE